MKREPQKNKKAPPYRSTCEASNTIIEHDHHDGVAVAYRDSFVGAFACSRTWYSIIEPWYGRGGGCQNKSPVLTVGTSKRRPKKTLVCFFLGSFVRVTPRKKIKIIVDHVCKGVGNALVSLSVGKGVQVAPETKRPTSTPSYNSSTPK